MKQAPRPQSFSVWLSHKFRHVRGRPRLFLAIAVFLLGGLIFSGSFSTARALLLSFNLAAASYIILILRMMSRSTLATIQKRAQLQQEGRWAVLGIGSMVSMATLVAISLELHAKNNGLLFQVLLSVSTVVLVWVFVNLMFTLHYAHDFYLKGNPEESGLEFPGTKNPDYWDFMYFAFVIGMTFQVSDVQISSRELRRIALLHSVISFFFNVVIIAITVNIIAGWG